MVDIGALRTEKARMALKYIITEESELPSEDALKGLYSKEGDQWILQVEGAVPKKQHDEFREGNIELRKKLEKFGDMDPDEAAKLQKKVEDLEAQIGGDKKKLDDLLEKRVGEMKQAHETEIVKLKEQLGSAHSELDTLTIDRELLEHGSRLGLRETAHADLIARGRSIFTRDEDGKIVAKEADGSIKYGPGGDPLTVDQFVKGQLKEASHLFDPSKGSGSGGSGSGNGGHGGKNPFKKGDDFNMSEQAKIIKSNPDLARTLAAQAGVTIDLSNVTG